MTPQAHVAAPEEACSCPWCGQAIDAGDWLYEGHYCSKTCFQNDNPNLNPEVEDRSSRARIVRFRIKQNRSPWRPIES